MLGPQATIRLGFPHQEGEGVKSQTAPSWAASLSHPRHRPPQKSSGLVCAPAHLRGQLSGLTPVGAGASSQTFSP